MVWTGILKILCEFEDLMHDFSIPPVNLESIERSKDQVGWENDIDLQTGESILEGWRGIKANGLAMAILVPRLDFGTAGLPDDCFIESAVAWDHSSLQRYCFSLIGSTYFREARIYFCGEK